MINSLRIKAVFMAVFLVLTSSGILLGCSKFLSAAGGSWTLLKICFTLFAGTGGFLCFCLGGVYFFIASRHVSEYLTLTSALRLFVLTSTASYKGKRSLDRLRFSTRDPRQAQEDLLQEIVQRNKETEYGIRFKLGEVTCLADLRSEHPLTRYDHYEPYVQRIAKGEENLLSANKVSRLVLTSGTTGKGKMIPGDRSKAAQAVGVMNTIQYETFPALQPMQRGFRLHCNSTISRSECGIPIAPGNAVEKRMTPFLIGFSTPADGCLIKGIEEAFYVHFLFALRERDLGVAMSVFVTLFVDGLRYFQDHWPRMVHDLANGTLSDDLDLPASIRESLTKALGSGDPERAEEVREECEKGQRGLLKRLWPRMVCLATVDNIGIRDRLMATFAEGLVVYSPVYAASEAWIGYNLDPLQSGKEEYVLMINDFIYEFIPLEDMDKPDPRTLFVDEVELGGTYELMISQMNGLYRYRMGDVIQVSGFYNNTPKVKFQYRTGTMLNLFGEKVDQVTVVESLNSALSEWTDVSNLRHYCVVESTLLTGLLNNQNEAATAAHYVLFLEMVASGDEGEGSQITIDLDKMAQQMDDNMNSRHAFYRSFRDTNKIGRCGIFLVKPGSFQELKAFILANTTAAEMQFKMPKKLRTREMAEIMCKNILQT